MKKCIILVTLLLVAVMMFSACAGVVDAGKFYKNYTYEAAKVLASAEEKDSLEGKSTLSVGKYLVVMNEVTADDATVSVYNLNADKEVWTKTYSEGTTVSAEILEVFDKDLIVVNTITVADSETTETTVIYDDAGNKVAEADEAISKSSIAVSYDLFQFDTAIYRVGDEGVETVKEANPFNMTLPSFDFYNGELYITYDYEMDYETTPMGLYFVSEAEATVYDADLTLLLDWEPGRALNGTAPFNVYLGVLNNGTLFYQYTEVLPELETEYDFVQNGVKYDLVTILVDPESGKEKDIDVDYVMADDDLYALDDYMMGSETMREYEGIHNSYDNIAVIYYIEDGKIYDGANSARWVALSNKGKIKGELFSDLPNIGDGMLNATANDMYYYTDTTGTRVLINKEGDKVAEIHNYYSLDISSNENFYVYDGVIYDKTFTEVFDFGEDDYTLTRVLNYGVLLEKEGALYIYENATDGVSKIYGKDEGKTLVSGGASNYYAIFNSKATEGAYTYYNAKGEELFTADTVANLVLIDNDEGNALFSYTNKELKTVYVRATVAAE